jgi:hypothetical protein
VPTRAGCTEPDMKRNRAEAPGVVQDQVSGRHRV